MTKEATADQQPSQPVAVLSSEELGRCANAPACGCREAEQQCAAKTFARRQQWADRWREMAKAAGWKDTPTVRQAFWGFNISDFAARVAQAESERYAPLMQAVEWLLDDGHMNQEHLARLRAAFEAA